jgi:hypothetical protein
MCGGGGARCCAGGVDEVIFSKGFINDRYKKNHSNRILEEII